MKLLLFVVATVGAVNDNPISKVLALLGDLQKKVLLDGEVEQKQYEKFSEWCEDEAVSSQHAIKTMTSQAESLSAAIDKASSEVMNADSKIGDLAKTITTNEKDLAAATAIRTKEAATFAASEKDLEETIDMLGRAIGIIAKNKGASFAQVSSKFGDLTTALEAIMDASVFSTAEFSASFSAFSASRSACRSSASFFVKTFGFEVDRNIPRTLHEVFSRQSAGYCSTYREAPVSHAGSASRPFWKSCVQLAPLSSSGLSVP